MSEPVACRRSRVFGPVPSRRLGRSLGVDIIPAKTCTFDCVYCQVGRTTCKTVERRAYVPRAEIVHDLGEKLAKGVRPDVITIAGSGEPTLHLELGDLIGDIKQLTDIPVAVLTNGSLLFHEAVRAACRDADLVLPSLDAGDEATYQRINRPHEAVTFEKMVEGLVAFRQEFRKPVWLEVFLVDGINTTLEHVQKIRRLIARIRPDNVHLNTAVRPTAEASAVRVPETRMQQIAAAIGPRAEVVADYAHVHDQPEFQAQRDDVLEMLARRPCTVDDVASGLSMHPNHVLKFIEELTAQGRIREARRGNQAYYVATP